MTTINKNEIQKFSNLADEWWDVNGKFKPLHQFNPIRIEYILNQISNHFKLNRNDNLSLKGIRILDIGCGGGLISEPLSRLGAKVTGIDASEKNIKIAKIHSAKSKLNINYIHSSPERLRKDLKYDVILNLEVVEHVEDLNLYLKSCSELIKNNGIMFTATLNRTLRSYVKAIIGAEYILRWLPIGTHEWVKFIRPEELETKLSKLNFEIVNTKGIIYNILSQSWSQSDDCSVNYIMTSIKN